eukprot:3695292-Ditylum_brightwellii.AAC.1
MSRIRVHLAAQITSQRMIMWIDEYADHCDILHKYELITKVFENCEPIDSPNHHHLLELAKVVMLFTDWKFQCGDAKGKFITQQSYEDLT